MINTISIEDVKRIICPTDKTFIKGTITLEDYKEILTEKYMIATLCKPDIVIEIGVRTGYGAWAMLNANPRAYYAGFDANNGKHGGQGGKDGSYMKWAKKMLVKEYPDALISITVFDTQTIDRLPLNIVREDYTNNILVHVDGDHTAKGVQHDLQLALNYLEEVHLYSICAIQNALKGNSYILVDDYKYIYQVQEGVDNWLRLNHLKVEHILLPTIRGDVLIRML